MLMSVKENLRSLWRAGMRVPVGAMAMAAVLYGCGGGASSPEGPATALPEEKPVTLPITKMPASSYSGFKQEAFERLNEARIAAGVSAVKQNAQLDAAAQAHAEYLAGNYVTGHYEDPAKPLFTGYGHNDRAKAQGYPNYVKSEIITSFYSIATGRDHIGFHLNSVYHLAAAMDPAANEIGIGVSETSKPARYIPSSFTFGTTDRRLLPVEPVWVWPVDGASRVPRGFIAASESPNPLPDLAPDTTVTVGAPIMFCGSRNNNAALEITHLRFIESASQIAPKARVLHHRLTKVQNISGMEAREDPNMSALSYSHCVFILPLDELAVDRAYTVSLTALQGGARVEKRWSFTTAP